MFLGPGRISRGDKRKKGKARGEKREWEKREGAFPFLSPPSVPSSALPFPSPLTHSPLSDACLADNAARVALFYLMSYTQQNTLN